MDKWSDATRILSSASNNPSVKHVPSPPHPPIHMFTAAVDRVYNLEIVKAAYLKRLMNPSCDGVSHNFAGYMLYNPITAKQLRATNMIMGMMQEDSFCSCSRDKTGKT